MAMGTCRECGKEVSKSAKTCPNCGIKKPVKSGEKLALIIVLIILACVFFAVNDGANKSKKDDISYSRSIVESRSTPEKKPAAKPAWKHFDSEDQMSGDVTHFATSPTAYPTQELPFPYSDLTSVIGVGCNKSSKWAYFKFSTAPNLVNDETHDGYNVSKSRIRWGDTLDTVTLIQTWGDVGLHAKFKDDFIGKLRSNDDVILELEWYGQGSIRFKYSLNESKSSIDKALTGCK